MLLKIRTSIRTHVSILRVNFQLQNHRDRADINRCTKVTIERPFLGQCLHNFSLLQGGANKSEHIKHASNTLSLSHYHDQIIKTKIQRYIALSLSDLTLKLSSERTKQIKTRIKLRVKSDPIFDHFSLFQRVV